MNRLKELRLEKHRNMRETAQLLNLPYTTYINYEKNLREPNSELLVSFADFYNVSVDYLIGRSDERIDDSVLDSVNIIDNDLLERYGNLKDAKQAQTIRDNHLESNVETLPNDKIRMIPIFESVSAGFGAYACSDIVDYIPLYIANDYDAKDTICIKVRGNSMYPKIEDGDMVVVRKQSSVDSGQVAVVLVDGDEGLVKKVVYDKNTIELHSFNPEYQTKIFEGRDVLRVSVVGLVKQVIKNL